MGLLDVTRDLALEADMAPHAPEVVGTRAVAQRLRRRLVTRRGTWPWWPTFGTDLRQFLLSKVPAWRIAKAAEAELAQDEQVQGVVVQAEVLDGGRRIRLRIFVKSSEVRNFNFTMDITEAAATLLALQEAA